MKAEITAKNPVSKVEKLGRTIFLALSPTCALTLASGLTLAANLVFSTTIASAKEMALTFDDAPYYSSDHMSSQARTELYVKKMKELNVPSVMIFSNPCKNPDPSAAVAQMKLYVDAGHKMANHTCSHPRLDDVGYNEFTKDTAKAEAILKPLMTGQKFFRYPMLNEGTSVELRDQVREWLNKNNYRTGDVSIDNDDYYFTTRVNDARKAGKSIDMKKIEALFLKHLVEAAEFYDQLAVKTLGYSPKHVMLLHERDVTVTLLEPLVQALRAKGWTLISAEDAYKDPMYSQKPRNTYANNGLVAQLAMEKTGQRVAYDGYKTAKAELDKLLGPTK